MIVLSARLFLTSDDVRWLMQLLRFIIKCSFYGAIFKKVIRRQDNVVIV